MSFDPHHTQLKHKFNNKTRLKKCIWRTQVIYLDNDVRGKRHGVMACHWRRQNQSHIKFGGGDVMIPFSLMLIITTT